MRFELREFIAKAVQPGTRIEVGPKTDAAGMSAAVQYFLATSSSREEAFRRWAAWISLWAAALPFIREQGALLAREGGSD